MPTSRYRRSAQVLHSPCRLDTGYDGMYSGLEPARGRRRRGAVHQYQLLRGLSDPGIGEQPRGTTGLTGTVSDCFMVPADHTADQHGRKNEHHPPGDR